MGIYTSLVADFITKVTYEDLPKNVVNKIKLHIIDNLSNVIGGGRTYPGQIIEELYFKYEGVEESTFLHNGKKGPSPFVTNVNAYLSNVLDFDDTYENFAHPGATVIPPAFAIAERENKTGKELITAIVLGYEISLRIGRAIIPSPERAKEVWGFATWQTLGSVISSAKLLDLNKDQTLDALGIAGMSAPVPSIRKLGMEASERPFTWLKNNYGWSAMAGVISSELANTNFIGNRSILDGNNGFWIMAGSDKCDYDEIEKGLGETYLCIDTSFKPYPSCRWTHAAIDAVKLIYDKYAIQLKEVKSIKVYSFKEAQRSLSDNIPQNIIDAQFSLPYLISLELNGRSCAKGLKESDLKDKNILEMAKLVELKVDDNLDIDFIKHRSIKALVEIRLKNGEKLSQFVDVPKGDPRNPITNEQIKEKFLSLTGMFSKDKQLKILEDIENIENINNVNKMIESWYMD